MKKFALLSLLALSSNSFAGLCIDLKFDVSDKICQSEMERFFKSVATDDYVAASNAKDACIDEFLNRCDAIKGMPSAKICNELALQSSATICNKEAAALEAGLGTRKQQKLKKALNTCRAQFVKMCKTKIK